MGSQNCSNFENGAYTGEINASMLKDANCNFCIIGHSERRMIFNENSSDIKKKAKNLLKSGINPIICIGETLDEKKEGVTKEILKNQIIESIPDDVSNNEIIIAYEPIWAIGTGMTPSLEEINSTHQFIREHNGRFKKFKILYGGSVKAANAKEIISLSNVDGALIGGSSLKIDEFTKIIQD